MTIVVTGAIMAAVIALGAAWFVYRTITDGKHHTTLPPTVAAHHPLPTVVDLGPDTATWPAPRHTHRDPTTGRYTRKEQ